MAYPTFQSFVQKYPKIFNKKMYKNIQNRRMFANVGKLWAVNSWIQLFLLSNNKFIYYCCLVMNNNTKSGCVRSNKYDDWICLFCQNHNYSFRLICNRCRMQTKEQNAYMMQIYQQHLDNQQEHQQFAEQSVQMISSFPHVLLLMINDDPWEEYPQRREPSENLNVKWINNLIEQ